MSNLVIRSITGTLFVLMMVAGILWNVWSYIALFSLITLLGLWEFYSLTGLKEKGIQKLPGMALGIILLTACSGKYFLSTKNILSFPGIEYIILLFPLYLIYELFKKDSQLTIFSPTLFGILFIVFPFCYIILYFSTISNYASENNAWIILGYFILMWSNDTFAYLVGRSLGKRKLFEKVSPKKTWEGAVGGLLCSQLIAAYISTQITTLTIGHWLGLALIVSVFGTLGDLVESKFKRSLDVKDSGTILPGHGGILDRFDGVIISAPFVISYLLFVNG